MKTLTREKLIKTGAKAMLAKSYNSVGIQEILTAVDVPKGSFYHFFSSKEDLGVSIVEYYGEQLGSLIRAKLSDANLTPRRRLIEYFMTVRSYYEAHGCGQGCLVGKLATEVANVHPRIRLSLKNEFDKWSKLFAACISEAQNIGEISPDHDPNALAEFIYTSWEGALIRMQVNHDLTSIDNFIKYIFDRVLPPQ